MTENFNIGDVIYPIKNSYHFNMTQLKKVIKAEIIEFKTEKIAIVKLISLKEDLHPNIDDSPINSLMSNMFHNNKNIRIKEGDEIEVFLKGFYKKTKEEFCEFGKYSPIFYLKILKNSLNN